MKFIFQILFLQNKSPQFYFSPSPPCFTILKFLSSFFHCLGLKSTESWKSAWCACAAERGPYERRLHRTFLSHTSVLQETTFNFSTLGTSWMSLYNVIPIWLLYLSTFSFPGGSDSKESACNAGDLGLIPGLGRSLGEGNSYPLQYSCLENSMDRGAWQATVHGVAKNWTWLSDLHLSKRMVNI